MAPTPHANDQTNGGGVASTEYGKNIVNGVVKSEHKSSTPKTSNKDEIELVLQSFRLLVADLCQQFSMGHGGAALGMAAIGVALFKYAMRYAPHTPTWFNRDRFLMSNGHACLFQYINLHFTGYKSMTWEQLKSYHSERADSLCAGHPEIEVDGVEVTTGPLGQGIANAVGLAVASKHLGAIYNREGFPVVDSQIFVTIGDACLQEGVGCEAFSLAGHWKLNNLTCVYDNNQISCDGSVDLTNTEDVNVLMRGRGWDVIDVQDGVKDVDAIVAALETSRDPSREKPLFINIRTIIGYGSAVAGQAISHGAPLGVENVAEMKRAWGWDPEKHFHVPEAVREFYADIPKRGEEHVIEWNALVAKYKEAHPELGKEFQDRVDGKFPADWDASLPKPGELTTEKTPTRKSNNHVMVKSFERVKQFMIGTADLTPSVNMTWPDYETFNPPDLQPVSGKKGSYSGRYIHYGVREHAMAAIANGLAAYSPGTILPITSSFFIFYLYGVAAVRMGSLQRLQVIHVATHDSIGTGEDGPTHEPTELAALFRAMPDALYIRPADGEEVAGAWKAAVEHKHGPSMISVSRHALPQTGITNRDGVLKGAYVTREKSDADVTLIGVGAEFHFAVDLAKRLESRQPPIQARVVSFPSHALFRKQTVEYQRNVLRRHEGIPAVVIEPYSSLGWERWADAGFNLRGFGKSLPGKYIYDFFNFTEEKMSEKVNNFLQHWKGGDIGRGEYTELLDPPQHRSSGQ